MKMGTINWIIKPVDGGPNVFVHLTAVEPAGLIDLKEGQQINFEIAVDQRSGEIFAETLKVLGRGPEETIADELSDPPSVLPFARLLPRRRAQRLRGS